MPRCFALFAPQEEKFPLGVEDLDPMIEGDGDEDAVLLVDGQGLRADELPRFPAMPAPLLEELAAIQTDTRRVGPNVFRAYCGEMIGCLFRGENIRRGIEVPVLIADRLLASALDHFAGTAHRLELASQVSAAILEAVSERFQCQRVEPARRAQAQSGTPTLWPKNPSKHIDEAVVAYADTFHTSIGRIQADLSDFHDRLQSEGKSWSTHPEANPPHIHCFDVLLKIAAASGYAGFRGLVLERVGLLNQRLRASHDVDHLQQAGLHYEIQGDREQSLHFTKLSTTRYEKARQQYQRVGDRKGVARAGSKCGGRQS